MRSQRENKINLLLPLPPPEKKTLKIKKPFSLSFILILHLGDKETTKKEENKCKRIENRKQKTKNKKNKSKITN